MQFKNDIISIKTQPGISVFDISTDINTSLDASGIKNGFVIVSSRHTTTAVTNLEETIG